MVRVPNLVMIRPPSRSRVAERTSRGAGPRGAQLQAAYYGHKNLVEFLLDKVGEPGASSEPATEEARGGLAK